MKTQRANSTLLWPCFPLIGKVLGRVVASVIGLIAITSQEAYSATSLIDWTSLKITLEGEADPFYPGTGSGVFTVQGSEGVLGILRGRNYRKTSTGPAYGINLPGTARPYDETGIGLVNGLSPDGVGVTTRTFITTEGPVVLDASYIEFVLNPRVDAAFSRVRLSVIDARYTGSPNQRNWLGIFQGDELVSYTSELTRTMIGGLPALQWDLSDFVAFTVGKQVSVRLYGLLGEDTGFFEAAQLTAEFVPLDEPLPEPSVAVCATLASLMGLRRRRKASAAS